MWGSPGSALTETGRDGTPNLRTPESIPRDCHISKVYTTQSRNYGHRHVSKLQSNYHILKITRDGYRGMGDASSNSQEVTNKNRYTSDIMKNEEMSFVPKFALKLTKEYL